MVPRELVALAHDVGRGPCMLPFFCCFSNTRGLFVCAKLFYFWPTVYSFIAAQ
jgi:hypothetical protein